MRKELALRLAETLREIKVYEDSLAGLTGRDAITEEAASEYGEGYVKAVLEHRRVVDRAIANHLD